MMIFVGTNVQAGASFPFNKVSIVSIAFFAISGIETLQVVSGGTFARASRTSSKPEMATSCGTE